MSDIKKSINDGYIVDLREPFIYESGFTYQVFFVFEPSGQLSYLSYPKTQEKQARQKLEELRREQNEGN